MSGGYSQRELGWASAQILKHPYFTTVTCDINLIVPFVQCVAFTTRRHLGLGSDPSSSNGAFC